MLAAPEESSPHEVGKKDSWEPSLRLPGRPVMQHSETWEAGHACTCGCSRQVGQQDGEQLEAQVAPLVGGGEQIPLGHDVPQRPQVLSVWCGPPRASAGPPRLYARCCIIDALGHSVLRRRQCARSHMEDCIICLQACLSRRSKQRYRPQAQRCAKQLGYRVTQSCLLDLTYTAPHLTRCRVLHQPASPILLWRSPWYAANLSQVPTQISSTLCAS